MGTNQNKLFRFSRVNGKLSLPPLKRNKINLLSKIFMVRFLRQVLFLCLCVFINTLQLVECDKQFLLFIYTLCFLRGLYIYI